MNDYCKDRVVMTFLYKKEKTRVKYRIAAHRSAKTQAPAGRKKGMTMRIKKQKESKTKNDSNN